MKHSRPCKHVRKLKTGKKILINKDVIKKRKNYSVNPFQTLSDKKLKRLVSYEALHPIRHNRPPRLSVEDELIYRQLVPESFLPAKKLRGNKLIDFMKNIRNDPEYYFDEGITPETRRKEIESLMDKSSAEKARKIQKQIWGN